LACTAPSTTRAARTGTRCRSAATGSSSWWCRPRDGFRSSLSIPKGIQMKRSILMLGAAMLLLPLMVVGQVANENLANGIIAARKKEAAMLQQYNWNQRIEILKNGTLQDLRIDLMSCDGEGNTQRSLLNDQQGQLPGGFLRKRIAENQRKDLEKYVHDVGKLVDQYTLPSAGKV